MVELMGIVSYHNVSRQATWTDIKAGMDVKVDLT